MNRREIQDFTLALDDSSPRILADECLTAIRQSDSADSGCNAFISLAEAGGIPEQLPSNGVPMPLAGVPVALKDNIDTLGPMGTTAGSLALSNVPVMSDAPIVSRLVEAGASIIGKTNLSEWANFRSTRSLSGWSSAGGQTRNPYALDRSPCGSSSGSGAAVAAGLVPCAVGTETDGSIICPSAINGIVGIKPTLGRVSRTGIVPIAASQDTAGPMALNVKDAALLLEVLSGEDPQDVATMDVSRDTAPGLLSEYGMGNLDGMRIGYWEDEDVFLPSVRTLFHTMLTAAEEGGADLRNIGSVPHMREISAAEFTVLLCEFRDDVASYLQTRRPSGHFSGISDLIVYNMEHRDSIMPFFGQELFYKANETSGRKDSSYEAARETIDRYAVREGLELMFKEYRLDVLVMPSNNPAWIRDPLLGDHFSGGSSTLAAVSGWPSMTIPMGLVSGLPVGLTLLGKPWMESRMIGIASYLEQIQRDNGLLIPAPTFRKSLTF